MKKLQAAALALVLCLAVFYAKRKLEGKLHAIHAPSVALKPVEASYHGRSLKKYSLGFDTAISSLLWVQVLQKARHLKIEDEKVSWEFAQLDAITTLDPHFWRAYSFGFTFLSVLLQDKLGAKLLLEKWVKRFPNDWRPRYFLGHHLFHELNDMEGAAPHVLRAASMEHAPAWLSALGVRLLSETGALMRALQMSVELYNNVNSAETRDLLKKRIRSIRYNLQKAAWERALVNYRAKYHSEPSRTESLGPILRKETRELASSLEISHVPPALNDVMREAFPFVYSAKERAIVYIGEKEKGLDKAGIYIRKTDK